MAVESSAADLSGFAAEWGRAGEFFLLENRERRNNKMTDARHILYNRSLPWRRKSRLMGVAAYTKTEALMTEKNIVPKVPSKPRLSPRIWLLLIADGMISGRAIRKIVDEKQKRTRRCSDAHSSRGWA